MTLNIIIMCGGTGSRLWPLSRNLLPKQFLKLTDPNYTMFQLNCLNALQLNAAQFIVVCNEKHNFLIEAQLQELNITNYKIVSEPFPKDTSAAIASASLLLPTNENILVLTADHVWDINALQNTVNNGVSMLNNNIVFIGIKPTYPEIGYGYIQHNSDLDLLQFVEKPNLETAKQYLNKGNYLWNSGIFLFNNSTIQTEFKKNANSIWESVVNTLENSGDLSSKNIKLDKTHFEHVEAKSVDYAIMEHQNNGKVISYEGYWCDIGSFEALYNHLDKDENKNVLQGSNLYTLDSQNCLVQSDKLVTLIGCNDLIITDTRDALLICDKKQSQKVKNMTKLLKGKEQLNSHTKVYRPWGWYVNVEGHDHNGFKVKHIGVYPKKRLSLQSHNHRSEHWVIVKGHAKVQVGKDFLELKTNQHVYIPKETLHRMENIGDTMVEFVETQIGTYLGEDDIVRYEDDFGRV